jgi:hypothetical protein
MWQAGLGSGEFVDVGAWWRFHEMVGEALVNSTNFALFSEVCARVPLLPSGNIYIANARDNDHGSVLTSSILASNAMSSVV